MVDRQKLEAILTRRFPGSTRPQIAAAANAIMGLEDEWDEVDSRAIAPEAQEGTEFKVLRRRAE